MENQEIKRDIIDRALYFLNPRAAYERIAWKSGVRSYDGGSRGRNNSGWSPVNAPAEQLNQTQRDLLRARSRDLERNAEVAESIIGAFERNIVGEGIQLQAKPLNKEGKVDKDLGKKLEEIFNEWSNQEHCDIMGETAFNEMQEMAIRRMIVDGGFIFVLSSNPYQGAEFPFILQMREVDEIDNTKFSYGGVNENRIINGIELNEYNKPVAFWFKDISPDGLTLGDSKRVPAERVIYLRKKIRPSQVREVPKFANILERIRDLNEYTEAVSIKERVLACLAVFIKKMLPGGTVGRGNNTNNKDEKTGYNIKSISPGMIEELKPGDDVSTVNPAGQASNAKDFISSQQRLIGSGQGLSYEITSRDMSQVNYSSARQGLIEDNKTYKTLRKYLNKHLCRVVYRELITQCVLSGKLNIPDFFSNKESYLKHSWIAPGSTWIDPLKEVKANEEALKSNQTTLAQICSAAGTDWQEVLEQRAEEIQLAKKLGITTNIIKAEGSKNGEKS